MAPRQIDLDKLTAHMGYDFKDRELLIEALTHRSATPASQAADRSYERLEFLGDRVLGLVVAEMLFDAFATDPVGDLARRHVELVRAETLAEVADELDLQRYILLSPGEARAGVRRSASIQADVMEAVLAAIYLDGGIDAARRFIRHHWGAMMHAHAEPPRDPKTALQEWLQGRDRELPVYRVAERTGPAHAPRFTVEVHVDGVPPVSASGPNKKAAETAAAAAMLEQLVKAQ